MRYLDGREPLVEYAGLVWALLPYPHKKAIREVCGLETELSTSGGTSDGRFIAPTGAQVVELGPLNATIHQVDECVAVADLDQLHRIYGRVIEQLLLPAAD